MIEDPFGLGIPAEANQQQPELVGGYGGARIEPGGLLQVPGPLELNAAGEGALTGGECGRRARDGNRTPQGRIATELGRTHLSGLGYEIPQPRRAEPETVGLWDDGSARGS